MEYKFNVGDVVRINNNEEDVYNGQVSIIDSIFVVSGVVLYSVIVAKDMYALYRAESLEKADENYYYEEEE